MWRRACLGRREDEVTLAFMWTAALMDVLFLVANGRGWWMGVVAALAVAPVGPAVFWWRRRRWDRVVQGLVQRGTAQVEELLQGNRE